MPPAGNLAQMLVGLNANRVGRDRHFGTSARREVG